MDGAVGDLDVLDAGLEQVSGQVDDLPTELTRRHGDGAAGHRPRPAAPGAEEAERRDPRVAEAHGDVPRRHAELVGRDLGEGRLVALAVGHLLDVDADAAVDLEHGAGRLGHRRCAGHDVLGHVRRARARPRGRWRSRSRASGPRPAPPPARTGTRSRSAISIALSSVARADMRTSSIGPVIIGRGSSSVRDHVAQPDLGRAHPQLAGHDVEHALAHPGLGGPRSPVGDVRTLVRR